VRNLIGIFGIALILAGCGGDTTDLASVLADQRPIEWWPAPWRGGFVETALVRPDQTAGPGPHPVIFALTWGDGSVNEVMDMIFTYWLDEPPLRGYYVVAPEIRASSLAQYDDLVPAVLEWLSSKVTYDPTKVALVGASNGGRSVFFSAVDHPDLFSALVGMPGRYEGDGSDLDGLAGKPVLLLVGGLDEGWLEDSQITFDFLQASGAEAELEVVDGQGHVLSLNMPRVMDWIDEAVGR
jgi:pimeloyl-ACP methyl ester carboxylesterase